MTGCLLSKIKFYGQRKSRIGFIQTSVICYKEVLHKMGINATIVSSKEVAMEEMSSPVC